MERIKELSSRSRLIAAIAASLAVITIVAVIVVTTGGSSGESAAETPASDAEIAGVVKEVENAEEEVEASDAEELKICMIFWNGEGNESARRTVSVMEAPYASATFSAIYPDKCLVTVANPKLDLAAQFLEGELEGEAGEMYVSFDQIETGSASTLDPSVTNWNLTVANEGSLWLKSDMEDPEF